MNTKNLKIQYDKDTDTLFITPKSIPDDAILFKVNDGYSVYVNKNKEIVGIVIEYLETETKEVLKRTDFQRLFELSDFVGSYN
jgi:uncharacterized protein YuzE